MRWAAAALLLSALLHFLPHTGDGAAVSHHEQRGHVTLTPDAVPLALAQLVITTDLSKNWVRWPSQVQNHLSYCVGDNVHIESYSSHISFPFIQSSQEEWDQELRERMRLSARSAATAWEAAADVKFTEYQGPCDSESPVWFRIELAKPPGDMVAVSNVVQMLYKYQSRLANRKEPWLLTRGNGVTEKIKRGSMNNVILFDPQYSDPVFMRDTLLHEFGHVLGFRHEHILNPKGSTPCKEDDVSLGFDTINPQEADITHSFDQHSVMNYDWCGGKLTTHYTLSKHDKLGAARVYGPPKRQQVEQVLQTFPMELDSGTQKDVSFAAVKGHPLLLDLELHVPIRLSTKVEPVMEDLKTLDESAACILKAIGSPKFCEVFGFSAKPSAFVEDVDTVYCSPDTMMQSGLSVLLQLLHKYNSYHNVWRRALRQHCTCSVCSCSTREFDISVRFGHQVHTEVLGYSRCLQGSAISYPSFYRVSGSDKLIASRLGTEGSTETVRVLLYAADLVDHRYEAPQSDQTLEDSAFANVTVSITNRNGKTKAQESKDDIITADLKALLTRPRQSLSLDFAVASSLRWSNTFSSFKQLEKRIETLVELGFAENVEELLLDGNDLTYIPGSVAAFKNLRLLDLRKNELRHIPDVVERLPKLKELRLGSNRIDVMSPSLTKVQLEVLDMEKNELKEVSREFCDMTAVKKANFADNSLEGPSCLCEMTTNSSLVFLDLSNNKIEAIPDSWSHINRLQSLRVSDNRLGTLSVGMWPHLTYLDASRNGLEDVDDLALCEHLETVKLDQNVLEDIKWSKPLKALVSFSASGNSLTDVPRRLYSSTNVQAVSLAWNEIDYIARELGNMEQLRTLEISNNEVSVLPDVFGSLLQLSNIQLHNNELGHLPPSLFSLKLSKLDVSNNNLHSIPQAVSLMSSLEDITVARNRLVFFPDVLFQLPSIRTVSLSDNAIRVVPDLTPFLTVRELDLSRNQIKELPPKLPNDIVRITFAHNQIEDIPDEYLIMYTRLKLFDLSNNLLSVIGRKALSSRVEEVSLASNRIARIGTEHIYFIRTISRGSYGMHTLRLDNNPMAQVLPLADILQEVPTLRDLSARNCSLTSLRHRLVSPMQKAGAFSVRHGWMETLSGSGMMKVYKVSLDKKMQGRLRRSQLRRLDLRDNRLNGEDDYVQDLIRALKRLQRANFVNSGLKFPLDVDTTSMEETFALVHIRNDTKIVKSVNVGLRTVYQSLWAAPNVSAFMLWNNQIRELPSQQPAPLKNLLQMSISLNTLTSLPRWLFQLPSISTIDVLGNFITTLPEGPYSPALQRLYLDYNWISRFPDDICDTNIVNLSAAKNLLTGLPECIGRMDKLLGITITYNNIPHFPESMSNLTQLRVLEVSGNPLGKIPDFVEGCKGLRTFTASMVGVVRLPEWISQFQELRYFSVAANSLSEVPDHFARLSKLDYLDFSRNSIRRLPSNFSFPLLQYFTAANNKLEALPESITKNPKLTNLVLDNNELTELPANIGELTSLKHIRLKFNKLETLPSSFGDLKMLERAKLSANHLKSLPVSIGSLEKLMHLQLFNNNITHLPYKFGKLTNLRALFLENNQLKMIPRTISRLSQLTIMSVADNNLRSIPRLTGLVSLQQLDAFANRITKFPVGEAPSLARLKLSFNRIQEIPSYVRSWSSLTDLILEGNDISELPAFLTELPRITMLDLVRNKISQVPPEIFTSSIISLYLSYNNISQLPQLNGTAVRLSTLKLAGNQLRSIDGAFLEALPQLKYLVLSDNQLDSVPDLPMEKMFYLKHLDLQGNKPITSLPSWISELKSLQYLAISRTNITALPPSFSGVLNGLCSSLLLDPVNADCMEEKEHAMRLLFTTPNYLLEPPFTSKITLSAMQKGRVTGSIRLSVAASDVTGGTRVDTIVNDEITKTSIQNCKLGVAIERDLVRGTCAQSSSPMHKCGVLAWDHLSGATFSTPMSVLLGGQTVQLFEGKTRAGVSLRVYSTQSVPPKPVRVVTDQIMVEFDEFTRGAVSSSMFSETC